MLISKQDIKDFFSTELYAALSQYRKFSQKFTGDEMLHLYLVEEVLMRFVDREAFEKFFTSTPFITYLESLNAPKNYRGLGDLCLFIAGYFPFYDYYGTSIKRGMLSGGTSERRLVKRGDFLREARRFYSIAADRETDLDTVRVLRQISRYPDHCATVITALPLKRATMRELVPLILCAKETRNPFAVEQLLQLGVINDAQA